MNPINGHIIVKFDYDKSATAIKQPNGLYIPERYVIEDGDEDAEAAWGVTTDRRLINPQVIHIFSGQYNGKRAFVHYGAFEVAKRIDGDSVAIPEKMILFLIDPLQCMPNTYLGEEVFGELPKTASGIYITPQLETKEGVLIRITHVPKDSMVKVGDIVVTIDQNQYELTHEGKKYIKLDEDEIVGIKTADGYLPVENRVLVYLLPDSGLQERVSENDRRRKMRDYVDHNRLHISENYTKGLDPDYLDVPEPKFTHARVLVGSGQIQQGDKVLIHRNYGCRLPNSQWILSMDLILAVVE